MEQSFGWLQKICRRMVIQLLDSYETGKYDPAKEGMAHSALNYYGSQFTLIPDIIPGLGYLDDFLVLTTTMWMCGERELPEPTPHEEEQLPYRLNLFLEKRSEEEAERVQNIQLQKIQQKNRAKLEEILLEQPPRIQERFASRLGISLQNHSQKQQNINKSSQTLTNKKSPPIQNAQTQNIQTQKKQRDMDVERTSKLSEMTNTDLNNPFANPSSKVETSSNSTSHM